MAYKAGQKYLRNKTTGAVFQYRERIANFPHLELMEANEEGELVLSLTRASPDAQLAPAKTPEKKVVAPVAAGAPAKPSAPTLAPVNK